MTTKQLSTTLIAFALFTANLCGQWQGGNPEVLGSGTSGAVVGTSGSGAALIVNGSQMSTPTGEVFRTDAPGASNTLWRLLRGGTERGRLFSLSGDNHFHMDGSNGDLRYLTEGVEPMRINRNLFQQTVNGYSFPVDDIDLSGYVGIGTFDYWNNNVDRPFAMLHLEHSSSQITGWRPWMQTGVLSTRWSDLMYVGLRQGIDIDRNDAVVSWADNVPGVGGPDALRFIFTGIRDQGATQAGSDDGLEMARFISASGGNEGFFGVGDWFSAGLNPLERVDVLNGRMRIRDLPEPSGEATGSYKVMVVDDTPIPSIERGVVKWVDPSILGTADCDWVVQNPDPHVSSVYDGSSCLWDRRHGVGIGMDVPRAKLHVHHNNYELLARIGTWSRTESDDFQNELQGVLGECGPIDPDGFFGHAEGVQGLAYNCKTTIGVHGHGRYDSQQPGTGTGFLVGVLGVAEYDQPWQASFSAGVYGRSIAPQGAGQAWAGFFQGDVMITGNGFVNGAIPITSDAQFKTGVEELTSASELLSALQPKRYSFNDLGQSVVGLPDGEQLGFIAQELEEVLPELVHETQRPADLNDAGDVVQEAIDYKAVNYIGLIPVLVAGFQELQGRVAAQESVIAQLQEELAACCAASNDDGTRSITGSTTDEGSITPTQERLLRIAPNPFTDRTRLFCTLEHAGRMQLLANSTDGRSLMVLSEGQREAGEFQYEWSTEKLAPGVYYITLLLDGEPVVKRAVKVGR